MILSTFDVNLELFDKKSRVVTFNQNCIKDNDPENVNNDEIIETDSLEDCDSLNNDAENFNENDSIDVVVTNCEGEKCLINQRYLHEIPEIVQQSLDNNVKEISAGQNRLQEIGLKAIADLHSLQILRLPGNQFDSFPNSLLNLKEIRILELTDNRIEMIPQDIWRMQCLEELWINRNKLKYLPNSIKKLKKLNTLQVAHNQLTKLPAFLIKMRTLGLVDIYNEKSDYNKDENVYNRDGAAIQEHQRYLNPPLTKVSLRDNQLRGSIILGNYGHLTQLDVSENNIEILDLSALDHLESLQCSRNNIREITLNGRILKSLIAGNNELSKLFVTPIPTMLGHMDVSYNKLTSLPDWINQCDQLEILFASNNQLDKLPERIFLNNNTVLHTLQLEYNQLCHLPEMPVHHSLPLKKLFLQNNLLEQLPENLFVACDQLCLLNVSSNYLTTLPSQQLSNTTTTAATATSTATTIVIDQQNHKQRNNYRKFINLKQFYATSNCLTDQCLTSLSKYCNLKILQIAYNRLTTLPNVSINWWPHLEELILSGNQLKHLPTNLIEMKELRVLRVHSNLLETVPELAKITTLRVLDLAHNQLDKIDLVSLVSKKLNFLDLSCNKRLQVDPKQIQECQAQRALSLVDVSGKNRSSLPSSLCTSAGGGGGGGGGEQSGVTTPSTVVTINKPFKYGQNVSSVCSSEFSTPWKMGFSETSGGISKLYVSQIRLPCFCDHEGLFGLFDGEYGQISPNKMAATVPKILLEEHNDAAAAYLKYALSTAYQELKDPKQQSDQVSAILCHIALANVNNDKLNDGSASNAMQLQRRCFVLRVACVGNSAGILIRKTGILSLIPSISTGAQICQLISDDDNDLKLNLTKKTTTINAEVCEIMLNDQDEYLVIGNQRIWEVMKPIVIAKEIRKETNIILAAKRIQDIAQSYGAENNLSLIIVKFNNLGTDANFLMRELRHTIGEKSPSTNDGGTISSNNCCKCIKCCETNRCCHSNVNGIEDSGGIASGLQFIRQSSVRSSDRSSPSGQSDNTTMDMSSNLYKKVNLATGSVSSRQSLTSLMANGGGGSGVGGGCINGITNANYNSSTTTAAAATTAAMHDHRKNLRNGVVRAVRARIDEEIGENDVESDSSVSEEQFKCWEYMLEQNTQLLFDKELNTISRAFTKKPLQISNGNSGIHQKCYLPLTTKSLSVSSPQLTFADHSPKPVVAQYHGSTPFLSRQFGSARSFHPNNRGGGGGGGGDGGDGTQRNDAIDESGTIFSGGTGGGGGSGIGIGGLFKSLRFSSDRVAPQLGGPNAAYFGSLQRLMPYNLEYDFAVMHERYLPDESLDYDQRMQQYWGVATTEL